jgi:hypothetical protein
LVMAMVSSKSLMTKNGASDRHHVDGRPARLCALHAGFSRPQAGRERRLARGERRFEVAVVAALHDRLQVLKTNVDLGALPVARGEAPQVLRDDRAAA